ncbi:MAG: hypothetical protein J7K37_02200 [Candidatus Omnitrophica bacterium]|nr:hypothetical protein [Candidatus Omnitrophota bacterium]
MLKKILFTLLILFFNIGLGFSQEVNIIYTGASFSALYPCGHCSAKVGGGLARRAYKIKELSQKLKNLLVLDSGSLFAGSPLDEFRSEIPLDKQRTEITLRALEAMGYQAIGVSGDEFSLGLDFFKEKIRESKVPFISCNLNIKGLTPFLIKDFPSLKVGITGISPKNIERLGVKVEDYNLSLEKVLNALKSEDVDLIILLSSLSLEETEKIVEKFRDIDLVILNRPHFEGPDKIEDTYILYPYYQAKKLGKAKLYWDKDKIQKCERKEINLALDVKEDGEVKKIIPACFRDSDCSEKEGLVSICENPGKKSRCIYLEIEPLNLTVITDSSCKACSTDLTEKFLKKIFKAITPVYLDYRSKEAKNLIEKLSIKTLPSFIFSEKIKERKEFTQFKDIFEPKGDFYLVKTQFSGIFYYLDRVLVSKRIDLFLDFYSLRALSLLEKVKKIAEEKGYSLGVHFIFKDKDDRYAQEEYLRILAVKQLYPEKFWDYLTRRLSDIKNSFWNLVLEDLGIDIKKISNFALSKKGRKILTKETSLAKELRVNTSGVVLIDNKKIFSLFPQQGELLEEFLN